MLFRSGHVDLARLLIEYGADAAAQSKDGTTPLHLASEGGHVDLDRLLIEHGADVAAQSKAGMTPLHLASKEGHVDLVRLLIKHGADVATSMPQIEFTNTQSGQVEQLPTDSRVDW